MSSILYYSNYCEHSKSLIKNLSSSQNIKKDIHFISIDKRTKDENGKTYIILETGQRIILPEHITRVPALLLLNDNYKVLYGEQISDYLEPVRQQSVQQATFNNMEPMAFSFNSGGFGDVVSDQYSFLDQNPSDLEAKGNGGVRQMHNYVDLNYSGTITTPTDDTDYKKSKMPEGMTVEKLQQQRASELSKLTGNRPPQV